MVGCYVAPHDASTLDIVVTAIDHRPRGTELLVAGDFNTYLESLYVNGRGEVITIAMATEEL